MKKKMNSSIINIHSNYLWFLTLAYSMVIVIANWFDARIINLYGLITDAGTLIFPLTFLLSDLITEVYGYKYARRAIWCGFLFNVIFILYGQLIIRLPSPDFSTNNQLFDTLLNLNGRIVLASAISYLISEPTNSYIIAKLKIKMLGRRMGLRFVLSTFIASGLDSVIFGFVAFYQLMNSNHLIELIVGMWFVKVIIEILGLPLSVWLAKKLKQIEHVDMYDRHTSFNLFNLETTYYKDDNKYEH